MSGRFRLTRLAALVVVVAACSTWRPVEVVAPADGRLAPLTVAFDNGRQVQPKRILVLPSGGSEVVLEAPGLEADTLRGLVDSQPALFALGDLRLIEARQVAKIRTLGLFVVGVPVVLFGAVIATCGDGCR